MVPDQPAGEGVGRDEGEADGLGAANGVAEDVEHVVPVVREGEGVDDGVVFDHGERQEEGEKGVREGYQSRPLRLNVEESLEILNGARDGGEDGREE